MNCPRCGAGMEARTLDGHLGTTVAIDLCLECQHFWFDARESLMLSPGSVLTMFRLIGERALAAPPSAGAVATCPRCRAHLLVAHDQQRNTKFEYLRCPNEHGRLITFVNFLREKNFIRPLSTQQIEELRRNVQTVNCSNCGAPIDITTHSGCTHCGSPLSMLDLKQAGALVAELRASEQPKTIDPALPLRLAAARREVDAAFAGFEETPGWFDEVSQRGLIAAGLSSLARWLKQQA